MNETMEEERRTILLFGRTGSGKSTVGSVLIEGKLSDHPIFATGNDMRGKTIHADVQVGRGWKVIDTAGFGEDLDGTVPTEEAKRELHEFFNKIESHSITHFAFVFKAGRKTQLDDQIWSMFMEMFPEEECGQNKVLIVTNADDSWVREEKDHLPERFPGYGDAIAVDLAPLQRDEETGEEYETQEEYSERFSNELSKLESWLDSRNHIPAQIYIERGRVLLFGRKGSGKSTVGNMLLTATLDHPLPVPMFPGKGEQQPLIYTCGRRWTVLDTPGIDNEWNYAESKERVRESILSYLRDIAGEFTHFCYVKRGFEDDTVDQDISLAFRELFKGAENNFVIIFTGCDPEGNGRRLKDYKQYYEWCRNFTCVDFPSPLHRLRYGWGTMDEEREAKRSSVIRERSLKSLERDLASFSGDFVSTSFKREALEINCKHKKALFRKSKSSRFQILSEILSNTAGCESRHRLGQPRVFRKNLVKSLRRADWSH